MKPVALLISEHSLLLEQTREGEATWQLRLPVGTRLIADQHFRHTLPTPLEIERAIEAVEDAVMPARARLPVDTELVSTDPAWRTLAQCAGLNAHERWLSLETVELLFNRLAVRAEGRPASQNDLPTDGESAARLLILREVLHHWGLDGIRLTD